MSEGAPTEEDRDRAKKIFDGDEDFVIKPKAAAWLGGSSVDNTRTRKAYMELFDWAGQNLLLAMRGLCAKLVLRAETQEIDRLLDAFSRRWCVCNPNHGFKATDVVHTICYSILLLNTDLHLADIEQKMNRGQFVKNTMPTIRRVVAEAAPEQVEDTIRAPAQPPSRPPIPWSEPASPRPSSPSVGPESSGCEERPSLDAKRPRNRLSARPPVRVDPDGILGATDATAGDNCNVLVRAPYEGPTRGWEIQVEIVLKEFYNSIRQQRLPLHGAPQHPQIHEQPSSNSLSVGSMLRRTPSVLSKAPSDNVSYRGRPTDLRSATTRWTSKSRVRPRLYPSSTVGSSRTSLDDGSVWSPAGSSNWSKYSLGKTQTSMSVDSLGSHGADYQQSIGFANALSQAIIREENNAGPAGDESRGLISAPLLEDETLELHGSPWAKEGLLKHKHHLEAVDKRSKHRDWVECFAVIEKGSMRLFSFNQPSKSLRLRNKHNRPAHPAGGPVGGGNWTENAEELSYFSLRQTIASALPPPGYSKTRPHVWALSLPTGAVHLFQVGTPDIVKEFVGTANYWAARLSKEPLVGAVSSIEYGWGDSIINPAIIGAQPPQSAASSAAAPRPSMQSSIRSSLENQAGVVRARLPGDRVTIAEWQPPTQSMMASNLMEVDQFRALSNYVKAVEADLARHNDLRPLMNAAFSPRHPNCGKAMANWERKSAYLLREIVKFRTYIDSLAAAQATKERIYRERDEREAEVAAATTATAGASASGGTGAKKEAGEGEAENDLEKKREKERGLPVPDPERRLMTAGTA
ncbi:hypothetical protein BDY21DRAFT_282285 [Lineolata rhizophorae]|uniref:SEC7 domain-containing protein n=1 Tax=Lineolata rhizophorae TaxID=578093 RepID=A0A6A6P6S9_9PEZI|nr:hypothetical protein BDY21DRAFT_282285 [Lineolata rhizophorae]